MSSRILVVDDEPDTLMLLFDLLSREGYKIDVASIKQEALDKIKKRKTQLVLIDILMDEADGRELAKEIRETHGKDEIKLIYVSVMDREKFEEKYGKGDIKELDISDYIHKPFNNKEFLKIVEETLSRC
ncbi:MAG: hypothetical protein B6U72_05290 [Candidatus Altiarchaeales archaeon ex4484_2]|nr:MAG: hypothetical protein B6U72_05290 [Candidatus Altiarchaeales archaeon ex4484_2]